MPKFTEIYTGSNFGVNTIPPSQYIHFSLFLLCHKPSPTHLEKVIRANVSMKVGRNRIPLKLN